MRSIEELADRSMHIVGMVMLMGALAAATHTVYKVEPNLCFDHVTGGDDIFKDIRR